MAVGSWQLAVGSWQLAVGSWQLAVGKYEKMEKMENDSDITLKEAQDMVDQWINTTGVRYFSELTNMAILTEEVGEVARLMARKYGDQSFKKQDSGDLDQKLADEFADVLWVLICLANQTGVDLTDALKRNMDKKTVRDKDRHRNNPKLR